MRNKLEREREREICLNLMNINNYSKDVLHYLNNDNLAFSDKEEMIAYFSTVPQICKETESLIYDLEIVMEGKDNE